MIKKCLCAIKTRFLESLKCAIKKTSVFDGSFAKLSRISFRSIVRCLSTAADLPLVSEKLLKKSERVTPTSHDVVWIHPKGGKPISNLTTEKARAHEY